MLTTKLISLTTKCNKTLKLIQKVNDRIEIQRSRLLYYKDINDMFYSLKLIAKRDDIETSLAHYKTVRFRLVAYFTGIQLKVSEETIKKCTYFFESVKY